MRTSVWLKLPMDEQEERRGTWSTVRRLSGSQGQDVIPIYDLPRETRSLPRQALEDLHVTSPHAGPQPKPAGPGPNTTAHDVEEKGETQRKGASPRAGDSTNKGATQGKG